jgi:hypothetical protein
LLLVVECNVVGGLKMAKRLQELAGSILRSLMLPSALSRASSGGRFVHDFARKRANCPGSS